MGNAWYCRKCEEGKFNLSAACVERFINEETQEQYSAEERWMNKLKCIDDLHSQQNGLTVDNINALMKKLEPQLKRIKEPVCKDREDLLDCLRKNPDCIIRCRKEMDQFVDCVDTVRIKAIKKKLDEMKESQKKGKKPSAA